VFVVTADYYYFKIGCKLIGKKATRVSMYLYLSNKFYNVFIIRCFGNSSETILTIVILNFYLKLSKEFDRNMVVMTLLLVVSFMARCTSIIGFLPLVLYKIY
jgi:ABC-type siderophore export system fused ATPase/permease subunit